MSQPVEQALRETLADTAIGFDTAPAIQRLTSIDYGSPPWGIATRSRRPASRWRRTALGLAGTAAALAVATAVLLVAGPFSTTTPPALAGWSATPAKASAASVADALQVCNSRQAGPSSTDVALAEARGLYTALIMNAGGQL